MRGSRAFGLLAGFAVLSFLAAMGMLLVGGDVFAPRSAGADVFSRSLIGHRAFVELLGRAGVEFGVGRDPALLDGRTSRAVCVLAPTIEEMRGEAGRRLRARLGVEGARTLLVLPERTAAADPERPGWVLAPDALPLARIEAVLDEIGIPATVRRPNVLAGDPPLALEARWDDDGVARRARIELRTPQLLGTDALEPVVASEAGLLIGRTERDGHTLFVVADPEPFANDGLARADHALLALHLVEAITPDDGPLLVDASLQGLSHVRSVWAELGRPPLLMATVQAVVLLLLALRRAGVRFGRPLPPRPTHVPGKGELIENGTRLVLAGGHGDALLARHADQVVEAVGRRLRAPRHDDPRRTLQWLAPLERRRSSLRGLDLLERARTARSSSTRHDATTLMACAHDLARWRREMLGEPRPTATDRR